MQKLTRDAGRHLVGAIAFGRRNREEDVSSEPQWVKDVHQEHARWWKQRNVVGLGIGHKLKAGRRRGLALVVFVRRKLDRERVSRDRMVPSELGGSPLGIRGSIPVDVRKAGPARVEALIDVNRPARPGYSVGNRVGGSGTIGCVVRDRATSARVGLTCAHVLAPLPTSQPGDHVLVPSLADAQANQVLSRARIGVVDRILAPGFDDSDIPTNLDLATFRPFSASALNPAIAILAKRPAGIAAGTPVGLAVQKVGASSEVTTGQVRFVHVVFWIGYPTPAGGEVQAGFQNVIGISHFSDPGDSGSLVLTEDRKAVGIVLGSTPEFTICLPIQRALDALGCDLVTA
jgi:hypothetical protein